MTNMIHLFGLSTSYLESRKVAKEALFVAGAELEIETVREYDTYWMENNGVNVEQDGSLRNNGKEFLLPPSDKKQLLDLFTEAQSRITVHGNPYSVRTSTHVHVNCSYFSETQVRDLLYLYAIFEPLAFAFVGDERRENIHCMPLGSTNMPNLYGMAARFIHSKWHKYTALNLMPLNTLGTVEFRHLYGTSDEVVFEAWLNFLEVLWSSARTWGGFSREHLLDLTKLKEVQSKLLSPEYYSCAKERPTYVLEDNLLDIQLAFI